MSIVKKIFNTKFLLVAIVLFAAFLRLYKLSVAPPSLFGDELDLGYQAYSVLKTGKDYRGNFLPINFHSLAEWRAPLYLYSAVPTVALFGITSWGVRLPAAIFGILDVFMIFLLFKEILSYKQIPTNKHWRSLLAAFLMAISPWSLQYSRAGFEVTEMLFFLMLGLWLFFKSLKNGKWLWLSIAFLVLTPWIYSTAKLFTLLLLVFLFVVFRREISAMAKPNLIKTVIAGLVVGLPLAYGIFFSGGAQRFNYISVFADPTTESNIGFAREMAGRMRGEMGAGLSPSLTDKLFYNKFYIAFKNSANESMHFFDFETLFFQEVHPLLQKAFVTFFWPEILIFALSLWLIVNRKIRLSNNFYAILFLAFVYFITTNYSSDRRLIFAVFPISMLMSAGVEKALSEKKGLLKPAAIILIFLTIYGWATNYFDRYVRADYWLDNRPLAYNFFFSYIKSHAQNYDQIVVSDTLYAAPTYCAFYITACDRIKVQNFDTFDSKPQPNTLYVGFTGNFLGPNRENADINQIISTANSEGLEVYDSKSILNNIASGYGQELVIAGPRK